MQWIIIYYYIQNSLLHVLRELGLLPIALHITIEKSEVAAEWEEEEEKKNDDWSECNENIAFLDD